MHVEGCAHKCRYHETPEEGIASPEAGARNRHEPSDAGAETKFKVCVYMHAEPSLQHPRCLP